MLKFDSEKLAKNEDRKSEGIFVAVEYSFSTPSICASNTQLELREDIRRVGGFDPEIVDRETFNLISNFG